jgi:hypothetical protein
MTNGSRRTALGALLLTLGFIVGSTPSDARNTANEDALGSFRLLSNNSGQAAPAALPIVEYGARDSKDKGLVCPACNARVAPDPGMLAVIGITLVSVGIFVRRRLLDREGESETA